MTTLYELFDFLEKTDTESLIQKITDVSSAINEDFGCGLRYHMYRLTFFGKINISFILSALFLPFET